MNDIPRSVHIRIEVLAALLAGEPLASLPLNNGDFLRQLVTRLGFTNLTPPLYDELLGAILANHTSIFVNMLYVILVGSIAVRASLLRKNVAFLG